MSAPELSRPIKPRHLPAKPVRIEADAGECAALAQRFGIPAVELLNSEISLEPDGKAVIATGMLHARIIQSCAVSGDNFPTAIEESIHLRFVEEAPAPAPENDDAEGVEIDLTSSEGDEIEYCGETFDLGEAIAQSLGLAIDPYAEGPDAEHARRAAGITSDDVPSGPLADALKALKKD